MRRDNGARTDIDSGQYKCTHTDPHVVTNDDRLHVLRIWCGTSETSLRIDRMSGRIRNTNVVSDETMATN
jgi:hypothetical protein